MGNYGPARAAATRWIDPRRPEASGIPKIKISETFDFAISAATGRRSEIVSKVGILDGAVMNKSNKHHAGASPERVF